MSNHIGVGDVVWTMNDWEVSKYICVEVLAGKYRLMVPGMNNISFVVAANQVWK